MFFCGAQADGEETSEETSEEQTMKELLNEQRVAPLLDEQRGAASPGASSMRSMYQTMDIPFRFRSPTLLLWGGLFGIAGFVLAACIGVLHYKRHAVDPEGRPYASGHGYWPATVSEMVHEWNSPEGRIFFGFCLVSAFLIFSSWYPFELRNAYTGSEIMDLRFTKIYWITFRQSVPAVGLLLLITVSTVPAPLANLCDFFAIGVHLLGAFLMFVGYIVCEVKCLQMCGFGGKKQSKYLSIEGPERLLRERLMFVVLLFYCLFVFCQVALVVAPLMKSDFCCADQWDINKARMSLYNALENTASGAYLMLKVGSFVSEVVSGLALIGSHVAIWYYCEERFVNYAEDSLRTVFDEEQLVEVHRQASEVYTKSVGNLGKSGSSRSRETEGAAGSNEGQE